MCTNLLFRDAKAPQVGTRRFFYYDEPDLNGRVFQGSLLIAQKVSAPQNMDILLYQGTDGRFRIGEVNLSAAQAAGESAAVCYLTNATDLTPIVYTPGSDAWVCKRSSAQLGALVGFLTKPAGILVGVVIPCAILLLYLIVALASGHDAELEEEEEIDEQDTDLEFVKSIQKKQQEIAERDARRRQQDTAEEESAPAEKEKPRMSDEEFERLEEEEAARRAERIAAVRSHMEQRRQTETPDGVPLYTAEIITKTHTLPIPKVGDKMVTNAQNVRTPEPARRTPSAKSEEPKPDRKPQPKAAAKPEPKAAEKPAPKAAAKPAAKPAPKIDASDFDDLMAFLDDEKKKL